jgi:hypothetical protein
MLFASTAVAVGGLQLLSHLGSTKYLWGNAKAFGIAIEGYTFFTTLLTAGTVSGLIINTMAGLIAWGFLELGSAIYGGTKVIWKYTDMDLMKFKFGFSTIEIKPTLTAESFAKWMKGMFSSIKSGILNMVSAFKNPEVV